MLLRNQICFFKDRAVQLSIAGSGIGISNDVVKLKSMHEVIKNIQAWCGESWENQFNLALTIFGLFYGYRLICDLGATLFCFYAKKEPVSFLLWPQSNGGGDGDSTAVNYYQIVIAFLNKKWVLDDFVNQFVGNGIRDISTIFKNLEARPFTSIIRFFLFVFWSPVILIRSFILRPAHRIHMYRCMLWGLSRFRGEFSNNWLYRRVYMYYIIPLFLFGISFFNLGKIYLLHGHQLFHNGHYSDMYMLFIVGVFVSFIIGLWGFFYSAALWGIGRDWIFSTFNDFAFSIDKWGRMLKFLADELFQFFTSHVYVLRWMFGCLGIVLILITLGWL